MIGYIVCYRYSIIIMLMLLWFGITGEVFADKMLIPMGRSQSDHLKAYGVTYHALEKGQTAEWLLNYRGGSFLLDALDSAVEDALVNGVSYEIITDAEVVNLYETIEQSNMSRELLEKAPKIAVYTPPNLQPWDDAVTLALTYADIPYDTVWDAEVLSGALDEYDWLHLHHEDFTGQYGKFYASYRNAAWYVRQQEEFEAMAQRLGFATVAQEKKAVAEAIREYVERGGFLFAMCSATDTIDIALAARGVDIVESVFDGDPPEQNYQQKLDFSRTFAFENFIVYPDPMRYEYSNIDIDPALIPQSRSEATPMDYFEIFEFSAKYDPVPAMLTQCHANPVMGFMGQTTEFNLDVIKDHVVIMGENKTRKTAKYIHGNLGDGTFTFYGGHDPEDYRHYVEDPPTQLFLHKNSPGYRLILNNVLFPGAKKKEIKT